jgi:hypothetical protein
MYGTRQAALFSPKDHMSMGIPYLAPRITSGALQKQNLYDDMCNKKISLAGSGLIYNGSGSNFSNVLDQVTTFKLRCV